MTETVAARAIRGDGGGGGWSRCPGCTAFLYAKRLTRHGRVCPECRHHLRLDLDERLEMLFDPGSLVPLSVPTGEADLLSFVDTQPYGGRLVAARRRTGRRDAVVAATGAVDGEPVVVVALDFAFMGGSIGTAVGDCVVAAADRARTTRTPLLIVSASGGARMQEGCVALMQLARTAQEIARLREAGVLVLNLNTSPTYGGATASFSSLGDVVLAEPGSMIGFAGPRVVRQTIRTELPPGFQTAEFLRGNGMVDLVVPRENLRETLARLLRLHAPTPAHAAGAGDGAGAPDAAELPAVVRDPDLLPATDAWDVVVRARDIARPHTLDYVHHTFDEFVELHGDRAVADDPALVAGVGRLGAHRVVVLGHQKGHDTGELVRRNFGMPHPEGYRKAMRLMTHAARFGLPVVTFVDTAGAHPGLAAEQRGQGAVIAECIALLSRLPVPVVTVVTGEGGSGGALALAVADRVLMLSNGYYSVISPEGCASILWNDPTGAPRAARALRITAPDLLRLGVVDAVVREPEEGAHRAPLATMDAVAAAVGGCLDELVGTPTADLLERRHRRFRAFGHLDGAPAWDRSGQ